MNSKTIEKELNHRIPKKINTKRISDPPIAMDISQEITRIFNLRTKRKERISEYMCKSIKKTKIKAYSKLAHVDTKLSVTRPTTSKDFRQFFEESPTTQMSRFMEKSIRKMIQAKGLEKMHPLIIDDTMKDTKLEYLKITHYAGINLRIKDKFPEHGFQLENFKFLGRTENYEFFLNIRKQFEIRWILHCKLLRKILEKCVLGLPYKLFNLTFSSVVDVIQLQAVFKEKIQASLIQLNEFYERIIQILESEKNYDILKRPSKYLGACTCLLSVNISRSIAHTVQSIVKFTENVDRPPYLKLYVDFEDGLVLKPTSKEIIEKFCKFLDDVVEIGHQIYVLEKGRVKGFENKTIFICLTNEFIQESKETIKTNIEKLYLPILKYLEKFSCDFAEIYSDINSDDFFETISDINFEEGCEKIEYYKKYIHKVAYIPDNEYFKIGQLVLTNYREKLHDSLQLITDSIFEKLCSQHLWEVTDICDSFKLIKTRAIQKPLTTEELIEIGKFMAWVRNEHLIDLQNRVHASLASLCSIIMLGPLTDDHMKTNSEAIKWLSDILPIVEHHSINFEQLKFEAEEKLQKVIEDINVMIHDVHPLLVILDEMDDIKRAKKYLSEITLHMTKIKEIQVQIEWINKEEVCLSFPKSTYAEFEHLKEYVYPFYHLIKLCLDVQRHVAVWEHGQFDLLDYENTEKMVNNFCQELAEIYKTYRKKLRQAQDDNLALRFRGTVDDPDILNWPAPLKICATTTKILEGFKPSLKLMKIMCNDALCSRHWKAMSEIAGLNLTPNAGTTLKKIMGIDLKADIQEYEIISVGATKEKQLLNNLIELEDQWKNINFSPTKNKDGFLFLTHLEDIESVVDDHIIKVLNMRGSVFVQAHEKRVMTFYNLILDIQNVILNWVIIQHQWIKLLPIFSIKNLHDIIPFEKEKFTKADTILKKYTEYITQHSIVIEVISNTDIVKEVQLCVGIFEEVQKGVKDYFEFVRQKCPRLFFIADKELVEIIVQKTFQNQSFFRKIFPGSKNFKLGENEKVSSIISHTGEEVNFIEKVELKYRTLEDILNNIEDQMITTLKIRTGDCYRIFRKTNIKELLKCYPQQILQLLSQISWTDQVENALKLHHNIKLLLVNKHLESSVTKKCKILKENTISNLERTQLKNLILNDLNNSYILNSILKKGVISETHFDWIIQMRYYFQESTCKINMCQYTAINYGFEYFGNSSPIVLTPDTDRCHRTILNAHFFAYNGLVSGPRESGKSKTIQNLAENLGILLNTFSCTEYTNSHTLLQLLKGHILCGSWLCFENFHLLNKEIFSILSQEMLSILEAKKQNLNKFMLNDCCINMNPSSFICVTTDVKSIGNLPENLKVLFRAYTFCSPDLKIIAETQLKTQGFTNSNIIAKKIAAIFQVLPEMLSFQRQYSFSIRILKQILKTCEKNKISDPKKDEFEIVSKCICDIFENSLLNRDKLSFQTVLQNTFQNSYQISLENLEDKKVQKEIQSTCEDLHLEPNNIFLRNVFNVYQNLKINHKKGVVIIGEPFRGKSSLIKVCHQIISKLENIDVEIHPINPKCLSYVDLFGKISTEKHMEWTDGVLSNILRQPCAINNRKLLIFDGQIDTTWTNSLHNIFEDSRLFLDSGEQLLIEDGLSLIFEATDLTHADPTLVSHCNIIYVSKDTLNWTSIVNSWVKTCDSDWLREYTDQIVLLVDWFVPPCLEFLETCKSNKICDLNSNTIVKNLLKSFGFIFFDAVSRTSRKDEDPKNIPSWVHASLVQAGIWSFGGLLDFSGRQKFDEFFKHLLRGQDPKFPYPNSLERLEVGLPQDSLLFDYTYLYKQRGTWKLWLDLLKNEKILESMYLNEFLVPTVDTLRCGYFLDLYIRNNEHFLLIGPGGVGKSLILKDSFVNKNPESKYDKALINFSHNISCQKLQSLILSKLNKRKSGLYTPTKGKKFLCYLDDMHMSKKDSYNISSAMELLRMYFDYTSWYGLRTYEKIHFEKLQFIGAMEFRNNETITKQILRHFNVFVVNILPCDVISKIYSQGLFYLWKKAGFPSDILATSTQIANATLNIYDQMLKNYKPCPSKPHYIFNLKSFSKVIKGCSILKKETYDTNKKIYLKLWIHEILRVFGDKLEVYDLKWLYKSIKTAISEQFSENFEEIFNIQEGDVDANPLPNLFFGTFNEKSQTGNALKNYEEIHFSQLAELSNSTILQYNEKHKYKLDLIFFDYALGKLARIGRVLSIPCENALLLGNTGCGRQTLVKLASFMHKQKFFQPEITRTYDKASWDADIKDVLIKCGAMNKNFALLVSEEQIIQEDFLDNLDYLFRDGELTDLYTMDEKQRILELSRLAAQGGNRNLDISSHCVFLYFNKRCKENLHLFLCLNISGEKLRQRVLKYPSIVSCNNVMLWKDWPDFALQSVAQTMIKNINIEDEIKANTILAAVYFHRTSQAIPELRNFVTPKAFLHLLKLFTDLIVSKQTKIMTKKKQFLEGLQKLSDAESQILNMQKALAGYQPQLEAMTKNAVEMTEQIALETIEVEKASALVRKDEKIAGEQALIAQTLKSECEAELAQAIPILEDAISALNTLKPTDITLVKSMKNPPDAIKLVMASVCVIKDVRPDRIPDPSTGRKIIDYWGPSKRILGDMNFLQTLKDFDKDHIKPEIMVKIRKEYLPHKDFQPHIVTKASSAAEGLCKWIIAMDMYDKVAKEVAPKKEKLNKAEKEYAQTMAILNQKKEEVVRIEEKLAALNVLLDEAVKKQKKLQKEVDLCNQKLNSAQKLIGSLSGEKKRWTETAKNLQGHYEVLAGDLILSSALIAYLAPLGARIRSKTIESWFDFIKNIKIPCTTPFDIAQVLSNNVEIDLWNENELPRDKMFIENVVIMKYSKQFCLFVDPQSQANLWIEKTEGHINLFITKFNHCDWLEKLESSILVGKAILIKDVKSTMPPCLKNLIYRHTFIKNNNIFVNINKTELKMHKNFRLYITCNETEPNFSLELKSRVNIINFALTKTAMQENILKMTVEIEQPEIKRITMIYIKINRETKSELKNLEKKILRTLCESKADVLEDQEAIQILDKSKELTKIAEEKQNDIKSLAASIKDFKKGYINVAHQIADIFICIEKLSRLNYIYQFSLEWLRNLYFSSILNAGKSKDLHTRCKNLQETFVRDLFTNINRALFEKDKKIFNFWLAVNVAISRKEVDLEKLFCLFGETSETLENNPVESIEKSPWIKTDVWWELQKLNVFENFKPIIQRFTESEVFWKASKDNWDAMNFDNLSLFDKLLLTKVIKPKQFFAEIDNFTKVIMGTEIFSQINFDMQKIYNESYSLSPVLFVSTPGEDVLKVLHSFANLKKCLHKFRYVSLGAKKTSKANQLIEEGQKEGYWLLIQNCHLCLEWLDNLDQNLGSMDFENTHENFRLFLTADPTCRFPLELLQSCIKVVPEQPDTLKKSLTKNFNKNPIKNADFFYGCPGKQEMFARLCYRLCFAHFILQRRQKISNWNIQYNFEEPELLISLQHLQYFVNKDNLCLMEQIGFFIGECNYGGLVPTIRDKKIVSEILFDFLDGKLTKKGHFTFRNSKPFGFPIKSDLPDYIKHISKLPESDNSDIFFLTDAEYLSNGAQSMDIFLSESRKLIIEKSLNCFKVADELKILTRIENILKNLPSNICETNDTNPIQREVHLYNNLIDTIQTSLVKLRDALDGTCRMSPELDILGTEISENQLPMMWLKFCYPTLLNLSAFLQDLKEKVYFFSNFFINSNEYWLGAFYFPRTLLCSAKLEFASKNNTSLENVHFEYEILNEVDDNRYSEGVTIKKLYLKGAKYDRSQNCLAELPQKKCFDELPPILFKPVITTKNYNSSDVNHFDCPIYKIETWRKTDFLPGTENYVTSIKLRMKSEKEGPHWIKRDVSIVCEVDLR